MTRSFHRRMFTLFTLLIACTTLLTSTIPTLATAATLPGAQGDPHLYVSEPEDDVTVTQASEFVDIEVPNTFRAGDPIVYTYSYENTESQAWQNVILEATWKPFDAKTQICDKTCELHDITGGSATILTDKDNEIPDGIRISLGNVAAGAKGSFKITLITSTLIYPQTGKKETQLAGSARLLRDGQEITGAKDTANTTPVGPVFKVTKAATRLAPGIEPEPSHIYPLDSVDFTITVENATGDDGLRPDARAATNVILSDMLPVGSDIVTDSLTPGFEYDPKTMMVSWRIDSLAIGETKEFNVRFRKLDVNQDCKTLNNKTLTITSDEMPLDPKDSSGETHIASTWKGAQAPVIAPLAIKSVAADPATVEFDPETGQASDDAIISIVVQNFYTRGDIRGAKLIYEIQRNATYVSDSVVDNGNPSVVDTSQLPDEGLPGGTVSWTFDINKARSTTDPTELEFRLKVRAIAGGKYNGTASLAIEPTTQPQLPAACLLPKNGGVKVIPPDDKPQKDVLLVSKSVDLENPLDGKSGFRADQGQKVTYSISLKNNSEEKTIEIDTIVDTLPNDPNSEFIYLEPETKQIIENRPPDEHYNDADGNLLVWKTLVLPPGSEVVLSYVVQVSGEEFEPKGFCNKVEVTAKDGVEAKYSPKEVCIGFDPVITLEKTANVTEAFEGEEVIFDLVLTNSDRYPYTFALWDVLDKLNYVGPNPDRASYSDARYGLEILPGVDFGKPSLVWELRQIAPGESLRASFVARMPEQCASDGEKYINELNFLFTSNWNGESFGVIYKPPVQQTILCKKKVDRIGYWHTADAQASLMQSVLYKLYIRNFNNYDPIDNIVVTHTLPPGFSYERPDFGGTITDPPARQKRLDDGRLQLEWDIPTIEKGATLNLFYRARAGIIVGNQISRLIAKSPNADSVCGQKGGIDKLEKGCKDSEDGYSYSEFAVSIMALFTAEPKLTIEADECLRPDAEDKSLSYILTLLNTNTRPYESTTVTVTLALGLIYEGVLEETPEPEQGTTSTGRTMLIWRNIDVEQPPKGGSSLTRFVLDLSIGNTMELELNTTVDVASPDGVAPLKDNMPNPVVETCRPAKETLIIAKEVNPRIATLGDDVFYQVSIANSYSSAITVKVEDVLPEIFEFVEMIQPESPSVQSSILVTPQIDSNKLTWDAVEVPAGSTAQPSVVLLRFKVKIPDPSKVQLNRDYPSSASIEVVQSSVENVEIDNTLSQATIRIVAEVHRVYLPYLLAARGTAITQ